MDRGNQRCGSERHEVLSMERIALRLSSGAWREILKLED